MAYIGKILFVVLAMVLFIVALLAAADNSDPVALQFLSWQSSVWPISWWMLLAFVVGVLFGLMLNFYRNTRLRFDARQANKIAGNRTRQLDQARADTTGLDRDAG
tara:strand:- start:105 stop:419 length:315 start_codon:yes stop_codon:yes gene_type:complete